MAKKEYRTVQGNITSVRTNSHPIDGENVTFVNGSVAWDERVYNRATKEWESYGSVFVNFSISGHKADLVKDILKPGLPVVIGGYVRREKDWTDTATGETRNGRDGIVADFVALDLTTGRELDVTVHKADGSAISGSYRRENSNVGSAPAQSAPASKPAPAKTEAPKIDLEQATASLGDDDDDF